MKAQDSVDLELIHARINDAIDPRASRAAGMESAELHVIVTGALLTERFDDGTTQQIAELVREQITSSGETRGASGKPILLKRVHDVSVAGLQLPRADAEALTASIDARLQQLLPVTEQEPDALQDTHEPMSTRQRLSGAVSGVCVCAGNSPGSEYPVVDPRTVAGNPPYTFALYFYEDILRMRIEDDATISRCQMLVGLSSEVEWAKEIAGWHLCNGQVASVSTSDANRGPNYMLLQRAECNAGVHTILFKKTKVLGFMTGMYVLDLNTFWPFLGGKKVTFTWVSDTQGSGKWGPESSVSPGMPDGTLIKGENDPKVYVIYGGAKFWIPSPAVFDALGFNWAAVQTRADSVVAQIGNTPGDRTLLREQNDPKVYVIYGGAKFWIPSSAVFDALGFNWSNVRTVPDGSLAPLSAVPRDETLLKEQNNDSVYLMTGGRRSWVTSPTRFQQLCLSPENLRIVPDGALAAVPAGPDL